MKRKAIMAAVLMLFAAPAASSAHRPATVAETTAMVYHASGRYYGGLPVNWPLSTPLRCFTADVATVVHGSTWGAWIFSSYADQLSHERQCRTGNGVSILHKIGTRWYVLWEGSDGYPPTHNTNEGSFILRAVPRRIAKDLLAGLA